MRDIGKNIRQLRTGKNMTQDELAEKLFVTRQTVSNYETGKSRPDVDTLVKISEILDTDIHQVIYGPEPVKLTRDVKRLLIGGVLTLTLLVLLQVVGPMLRAYRQETLMVGYTYLFQGTVQQLLWLCAGWTLAHLLGMALKKKPLEYPWVTYARRILLAVLVLWFAIAAVYGLMIWINDLLFIHRIRGVWEETTYEVNGTTFSTTGWSMLPLPTPDWFNQFAGTLLVGIVKFRHLLLLCGAGLWLLGFPKPKDR